MVTSLPTGVELKPEQACLGDTLCEFLVKQEHRKQSPIGLLIGLLLVALQFGVGMFISIYYAQGGKQFSPLFDVRELVVAAITGILYTPIIWLSYAWQSRTISEILTELSTGRFLEPWDQTSNASEKYAQVRSTRWSRLLHRVANIYSPATPRRQRAVFVVLVALWTFFYLVPATTWQDCSKTDSCAGMASTWLYQSPPYFFLVFCPIVAFNLLLTYGIGMRYMLFAAAIAFLFRSNRIRFDAFHYDNRGGLAFIRDFIIKSMWLAFLVGLNIVVLISFPLLHNLPLALSWDRWVAAFAFLMLAPIVVVAPVWSVQRAIDKAGNIDLEPLTLELHQFLPYKGGAVTQPLESISARVQLLQSLQAAYKIRLLDFGGILTLALTSLLPIAIAIASLWNQLSP